MIFFYYVTFWDTISAGIADGAYSKMLESPADYLGSILYHVWFLLLFVVFAKAIGNDKWLRKALVLYWIPAFLYVIIR